MTPPLTQLRSDLVDGIGVFEAKLKRRRQLASAVALSAVVLVTLSIVVLRDELVPDQAISTSTPQPSDESNGGAAVDEVDPAPTASTNEWPRPPGGVLPEDAFFAGGSTVVFWGAFDQFTGANQFVGLSLDTATGVFTEWADPQTTDVSSRALAWTGSELIICCGDGAGAEAYDPETGRWRQLATPTVNGGVAGTTWTGTEVFVMDGDGDRSLCDGRRWSAVDL